VHNTPRVQTAARRFRARSKRPRIAGAATAVSLLVAGLFGTAVAAPVPAAQAESPAVRGSTLTPGTKISLRATTACCTHRYLRHSRDLAIISVIDSTSALDRADATWIVRRGLADNSCFSFESYNYPGNYLRHTYFRVNKTQDDGGNLFAADATFCSQPGKNGTGVSLQSYNYPGRFIRHYNYEVYIASNGGPNNWDSPALWTDDVSWDVTSPWAT
jgi:hypothetical protein